MSLLAILLFLKKCRPYNISTSDIFRNSELNKAPKFGNKISFNDYTNAYTRGRF